MQAVLFLSGNGGTENIPTPNRRNWTCLQMSHVCISSEISVLCL